MRTSISAKEHLRKQLQNPEFRHGWEASAVGRALALWLIRYRREHQLEFDQLAVRLGLDFDGLADLEEGDQDPSAATLLWLSRTLGVPIELSVERGLPGEGAELLRVDATAAKAA
jgi:transcriptional regulator with XRE-family HTH domain